MPLLLVPVAAVLAARCLPARCFVGGGRSSAHMKVQCLLGAKGIGVGKLPGAFYMENAVIHPPPYQ